MRFLYRALSLFFLSWILSIDASSQQLNWAHSTGGNSSDCGNSIAADAAGNTYVAGRFGGTNIDFDPGAGTFLLSSTGITDCFVAKYGPAGQLLWTFNIGGAGIDEVNGIVVEPSTGNLYITGYFRGANVDFDPGAGVANLTSNGDGGSDPGFGGDIFLAKYNTNGNYQWAFNIGGSTRRDGGVGISLDGTANIYVGGYFQGPSVDFDPGPGIAAVNGDLNGSVFLAKYSTAGAYQWAFGFGNPFFDNSMYDIKTDAAGNVYTVGFFEGTNVDFDPGPGVAPLSSNGGYDMFIAKFNSNGQYIFANRFGNTGTDILRGLALDAANNIYVTGDFHGTVDFDPGAGVASFTGGQRDAVVVKYSSTGQYIWGWGFGGTNASEFGQKLMIDGNHLYITGSFGGSADMDPSPNVENITSIGTRNIYLGKYNLNGEYICAFAIGDPFAAEGMALASNGPDVLTFTGFFDGTLDFDPGTGTANLTAWNGVGLPGDIFLAKYTWPDNTPPAGNITGDVICAGEPAQLTFNATAGTGPFTIVYNDGTTNRTQNNVQSGVPFNIATSPLSTTTYTLVSIKDALRCSETTFVTGSAVVTVNNCAAACDNWLSTPVQGSKVLIGDLDVTGNQVTVEAKFIRTQSLNSGLYYGHLVSKHTTQGNVNYALLPNGCEITTSGSGYTAIFQNCPLDLNRTYHVAMVYNGSTLKYYRDGFLLSQVPCTGTMVNNDLLTAISQVARNDNPSDNQFLGFVNEVRIWNVARSQADIRAYMDASLPNPATQTGLLGYYVFDNTNNDAGATFNGTLTGGAAVMQVNPNCTFLPDSCELPVNVTVDFNLPANVCAGDPVNITNTSQGATSYFWSFCKADPTIPPTSMNLGTNMAGLSAPAFSDVVSDNGNYYLFVVNNWPGGLVRLDFGNSMLNTPTSVPLGNVGVIPNTAEGIQVVKDGGNWYAIIVGGDADHSIPSKIVKISFGPSITNPTPTGTDWGNIGNMRYPHDLHVFQEAGVWYGFTVNAQGSTITRFNFTNSFNNVPTGVNIGNLGGLNYPTGIYAINDNGNWRVFITSQSGNAIVRLDFGNSLLNTPTPVNLGSLGGVMNLPRDIYILKDCDQIIGLVVNAKPANQLIRLNFNNDLGSVPSAVNLGNTGGLNFPHSISQLVRQGNDLYCFITNIDNNSITRVRFAGCTSTNIPSSTAQTPPAVIYNQPGIYNVSLTVDDGLPTQTSICKQIEILDCGDSLIVNDYTPVISLDICKNIINVEDATEFNVGDTVLIAQMQGATIDLTNTSSFGTISSFNSTGNYEFNFVKSKTGNQVELLNVLTRKYDLPGGKVQLVRVPYYEDFITDRVLTCLPWDGSKGGILVFNVANSLQLGANIDVTGRGFRGGDGTNTSRLVQDCGVNDFVLGTPNVNAAGKGEGIAILNNTNNRGKGAAANAGGGGLDHNSGGGGGGNGGGGGFGGYQLEPCGNSPFDNRGIGGRAMTYNNTPHNKIFMGGAGGAGHSNNPLNIDFPTNGANGGALVIISAQSLQTNSNKIISNGADAPGCNFATTGDCHDAMGGGGAGGTVLLNIPNYTDATAVDIKGGKGADVSGLVRTAGRIGPGGGGGGGVFWASAPSLPGNVTVTATGGRNGVLLTDVIANNPWGATAGQPGINVFNLQVPIATVPFKVNIDSVRFDTTKRNCSTFDFDGQAYINGTAITTWQWYFGDGGTASTQNTSHAYTADGDYIIRLVATDANGCKDSMLLNMQVFPVNIDFTFTQDICDPLNVRFTANGFPLTNNYWSFGDNATDLSDVSAVTHPYATTGTYVVAYAASNAVCTDTVRKTISINIIQDDIIITPDTTICYGTTKLLRSVKSLDYCWTPITWLDDGSIQNPTTSTPGSIAYQLTAMVPGTNLVVNGDFSQGNTGFTSDYTQQAPPNTNEGVYFIGPNPQVWNGAMAPCPDHTGSGGNMMLINGSPVVNAAIWKQTVTVTPNTNYAFSTWIQSANNVNPADLLFSINGKNVGLPITAGAACNWAEFFTTWNSGNNTTADISIVNRNTAASGNDFALDDISFAPVLIKREIVRITVDSPMVKTNVDTRICSTDSLQLTTTGNAQTFQWTPATNISNPAIGNPKVSPNALTEYIVTGTDAAGCIAKDTVYVDVYPIPVITKTDNTTICRNTSIEIFATGGGTYQWSPSATLSDPTAPNPTASPTAFTTYYVTITDPNDCNYYDSVKIDLHPEPVFTISPARTICRNDSVMLKASGGDTYTWQPSFEVTDASIYNPRTSPANTTDYSVTITEPVCNESTTLTTRITVNQLPNVQATSERNLDCSYDRSQLLAIGANRYEWSPVTTLNNPRIPNPVASPISPTSYIVKGTDMNGCHNYDTVLVGITDANKGDYLIPNAFTPNGDGVNDCYKITFWGIIYELEFSVYNRWGDRLFYTTDPNKCWDGTYKGQMQGPDVFVYMVKAKTNCQSLVFRKGTFVLIR